MSVKLELIMRGTLIGPVVGVPLIVTLPKTQFDPLVGNPVNFVITANSLRPVAARRV